jgi:hypothetical protein
LRAFLEFLAIYPGIPIATAYYAYQKGYSALRWLLFGLLLPVVTIIILYFLKEKSDIVEERNKPIVFKDKAKILYKKAD